MTFLSFLDAYKWTILFYVAVISVIYLFRGKFEWHGIIGLYKTKIGLKLMDRMGKYERFFKWFGYAAIVAGFAGMLLITGMLAKGLYDLVFVPGAPPVVSPVLPGITIPGVGIKVPLIIGWLALFIVIIVHEFSHGVVARAHKIPVKSSGLMVMGPIGGAFVEPEEKLLKKKPRKVQLSVFAAGPFSNLVLAGVFLLFVSLLFAPLLGSFIATDGVVFQEVQAGYPAAAAGVRTDVVYDVVNGQRVTTGDEFVAAFANVTPGENVTLSSSSAGFSSTFAAAAHPNDAAKPYLGVILGINLQHPEQRWLFDVVGWMAELCTWVFILSLGLGLANLLPLGPVDGGRMLQVVSWSFFGEKRGNKVWVKITYVMVVVLLILLIVPIVRSFL